MATTTEFLGLTLPSGTDAVDITQINSNFEKLETQAKAMENTVKANHAACTAHAAPMQDASVEGGYMLAAEYTFPATLNYESADLTLLVRNRVLNTTHIDGILRIRLRYAKADAAFAVAQAYWLINSGLTPENWVLAYNGAEKTARLYVRCASTYSGYVCKVLDSGAGSDLVNMQTWTLYSPTTGQAELPVEADGWTTVTSADVVTAAAEGV